MKKFLWVLAAVTLMSPSFAEDKKEDHASTDKKVESSGKKSTERTEGEAAGKGELAKKIDACSKARPETASKK